MKKYDGISIRSAASFREEARHALRGKWKNALLLFLILMLMTGMIIGAGCSFSSSADTGLYWELEAYIGPFTTLSVWKDGQMIADAATEAASPFVLPYSPLFAAAAAMTALMFLIFSPIATLGQTRLPLSLLNGITPDFSVLHSSAREYWLCVRTELLMMWGAFWPMLLSVLLGVMSSAIFPEADFLAVLFVIAGFAFLIIRLFSYAAALYVVIVRENTTAREAIKASKQMMKGRKWRYACVGLSFLGWFLLFAVCFGTLTYILGETPLSFVPSLLSMLALIPLYLYMDTAYTAFLRDADVRTNSRGTQAALCEEPASEPSGQNAGEPTPDDPWADTNQ